MVGQVILTVAALAGVLGGLWFLIEHVIIGSIRQGIREAVRRGNLQAYAQRRNAAARARTAQQQRDEYVMSQVGGGHADRHPDA